MFYLFGLSISFFLVLLIVLKRGKSGADYILLAWMVIVSIHLLLFYLDYTRLSYRYPHLLGLALPLPVTHGAFLYFYTLRTTRVQSIKLQTILVCLIPFIIMTILAIPFYVLPGDEKINIFQHQGAGFEFFLITQSILIPCSGLLFCIVSIIEIKKHRKRLLNNFSNNDKRMLKWLEYLAIGLAVIWITVVFSGDQVTFAAVVVFVLLIGIFGINQVPVFYVHQHNDQTPEEFRPLYIEQSNLTSDSDKYSKSGLKEHDAIKLKSDLHDFMMRSKPFKNPDLTLDGLAVALKIPANQLSQVINSLEGKTFYHYINTWRINEFLKVATLPENKKFTYLGLAYDCGFNSKTTFNKYFKILTGKTPSEYFGNAPEKEAKVA